MPLGPKMGPPWGSPVYIRLYSENMRNLLFYNLKAYSLDILYVASPSGHISSLFKLCPRGVTCKYIDLFRKNMKQSSFQKPQGLNIKALVFGM